MRFKLVFLILFVLVPTSVFAQTMVTAYGGVDVHANPDFMVMDDTNIGSRVVVEPWVEGWGSTWQVGSDVLVSLTKRFGVVGGINSNEFGGHAGVFVNVKDIQLRLTRHSSGEWQGVIYYTYYLKGSRWYVQGWATPSTDNTKLLGGVGYTFSK